jgi:hypothetical protein
MADRTTLRRRGRATAAAAVGAYTGADGKLHGLLLDRGIVPTIDAPGAILTLAFGLNNHGQVVGFYDDAKLRRGFLLRNWVFTTLGAPAAFLESWPFDIDDRGRIVGVF